MRRAPKKSSRGLEWRGGRNVTDASHADRMASLRRVDACLSEAEQHLSDLLYEGARGSHPKTYAVADAAFREIERVRRQIQKHHR